MDSSFGFWGVLGLVLLWNVRSRFWFKLRCPQSEATYFLMCSQEGEWVSCPVKTEFGIKFIEFECIRFVWNGKEYMPYHPRHTWTHHEILNATQGLSGSDLSDQIRVETGRNVINVPIMPLAEQVFREFFGIMPVYQYFCVTVWYIHEYPYFSSMILISVVITTILVIRQDRIARERLRQMAAYSITVKVLRENIWQDIDSSELLPGDLLQIPADGFKSPCDLVLVSGSALVDESFITGESVPVVKYQPEDNRWKQYDAEIHKNHTIYGSTQVVTACPKPGNQVVMGLVVRTGYRTTKGQLIKVILFNKRFTYGYEREAVYYLVGSALVGFLLFWVTLDIWNVFAIGVQTKEQILYAFESLVCLVPPFLPVIFNSVLLFSSKNLEKVGIYTTSPSRIPIAGKVKTMCFDKTGTLTNLDLDVTGVVPVDVIDGTTVEPIPIVKLPEDHPIRHCMTTCHSLASISDFGNFNVSGRKVPQYSGNAIDIKMFQSTSWNYHNSSQTISIPHVVSPTGTSLEIIKRFEFDPSIQRMSVLVRDRDGNTTTFVKGSCEVMKDCCNPKTIPHHFKQVVRSFSRNGCYILALAYRSVPSIRLQDVADLNRTHLENDLTFLGLLLMRNELKPDSTEAIHHVLQGRIRPVMVTGDNLYTAIYIARRCGIVDPQARCFAGEMKEREGHKVPIFRDINNRKILLDPLTWTITNLDGTTQVVNPEAIGIGVDSETYEALKEKDLTYYKFLINNVNLFARMRPLQKKDILVSMMDYGQVVGMIGDGANDCAALSAAHFGVALSEAEASLIAPFTAKSLSVLSVVDLVREGRASLANGFGSFKFAIFYSITETTCMFISYFFGADMSELEYIVADFLFFFPVVFYMSQTKAANVLKGNPPTYKIFGPTTLFSVCIPLIVAWIADAISIYLLQQQTSWYQPHPIGTIAVYQIPETTSLFYVNLFLLAAGCITWSFGSKWRQPLWSNKPLMIILVAECVMMALIYALTTKLTGFRDFMQMVALPNDLVVYNTVIGVLAGLVIILFEFIFVIGPVSKFFRKLTGYGRAKLR